MKKFKKAIAIAFATATLTTMSVSAFAAPAFADEITQEATTEETSSTTTIDLSAYPDHPNDSIAPELIANLYDKGNEVNKYSLKYGDIVYIKRTALGQTDLGGNDIVLIEKNWENPLWYGGTITTMRVKSLTQDKELTIEVPTALIGGETTHFYELNKIADMTTPSIKDTGNLSGLATCYGYAWDAVQSFLEKVSTVRSIIGG